MKVNTPRYLYNIIKIFYGINKSDLIFITGHNPFSWPEEGGIYNHIYLNKSRVSKTSQSTEDYLRYNIKNGYAKVIYNKDPKLLKILFAQEVEGFNGVE